MCVSVLYAVIFVLLMYLSHTKFTQRCHLPGGGKYGRFHTTAVTLGSERTIQPQFILLGGFAFNHMHLFKQETARVAVLSCLMSYFYDLTLSEV